MDPKKAHLEYVKKVTRREFFGRVGVGIGGAPRPGAVAAAAVSIVEAAPGLAAAAASLSLFGTIPVGIRGMNRLAPLGVCLGSTPGATAPQAGQARTRVEKGVNFL